MTPSAELGAIKNVPAIWKSPEAVPLVPINAFHMAVVPLSEGQPGEAVLTFGFLVPPMLYGSAEDQIAQAQAVESVDIEPLVRLTLSVDRAAELRNLLQAILSALGK